MGHGRGEAAEDLIPLPKSGQKRAKSSICRNFARPVIPGLQGAITLSESWCCQLRIATDPINKSDLADCSMIQCLAFAFKAIFKSRARLVAENPCLRQQLVVSMGRRIRPRLRDEDRRFWVLACRWFSEWRRSLWDFERAVPLPDSRS